MSEDRAQHTREPAEGADDDVEAKGAEQAAETGGDAQSSPPSRHTTEPAEGSDDAVDARGAERAE